ncbi:MAG: hypothetical protein H3C34_15420 [Caldilineaceae bacterium]|nr:hypothetical protein [Caldilineaceae bacterium]
MSRRPPQTSLQDALDLFIVDGRARRFTSHTVRFHQGRLGLFVTWCQEQGLETTGDLTS